ncbi:PGAP1-like protein-domain-containing protein [Boletus edulis BED1]|uniref:GPI inositol-deacylase n=1 Tax=Boletus edulis BED1 TaxID=1328754 RepID=A0AAD4GD48_BOLED|nr:PGAP1-like protein-domain-containing protein [Boletus edulis BED1]
MTRHAPTILGLLTLSIAYTLFRAASDVPRQVSPQGCRMSWMSPSYLLQSEFNTSWTPLAGRYSLWLYREVGWEPNQAMGLPVLFIPGNAGSSHQVRSIASSASRQYFSSPVVVSHEFTGRGAKPMDFYAVEFNEDLSAFHGSTLDSQIAYASAAVDYILSHYRPGTQIIVMGHSMGGVVGTALLPSANITALITMSTPHTLPPARFDARIEAIYDRNQKALREDGTPILSICGGATDMMIPSESCILPEASREVGVYRRTVFTSALEGAWTGVGHREMVWCHQVRWRVARAALELGITRTAGAEARARVLDRWLRDGSSVPLNGDTVRDVRLEEGEYEVLSRDSQFVLNRPLGKRTYLLPIPSDGDGRTFVLYVSQGSLLDVSPHHGLSLRVSVHHCAERGTDGAVLCNTLAPASLTLLPSPIPGKPFPAPDEGADESEGIVFFTAEFPRGAEGWVAVTVDAGDDGRGWVAGGFDQPRNVKSELSLWDLLSGAAEISIPRSDSIVWRTHISLPRLPATALLVYRLVPRMAEYASCAAPLFSPLLVHTSMASELHYYRLESEQFIFLHTHSSAPYTPSLRLAPSHGLNLTIHSSGHGCRDVTTVLVSVDWWASMGRMATRYPTTLLSWGVGIVSLLLFHSWGLDGQKLGVHESLDMFVRHRMAALMAVAGSITLLPLGPNYYLGIGDELGVLRAVLAALLVGVATGMVCVTWWLLVAFMWPLRLLGRGKPEDVGIQRSTVISMVLVLALILVLVPWQVAFLGCWIIQLLNCNATFRPKSYPGSVPTLANTPTDSTPVGEQGEDSSASQPHSIPSRTFKPTFASAYNQNTHILLLMTWLLPLVAPVLVVWVRTIQTAGYTTPFNGDHDVFKVAPVLLLVGRGRPLDTTCVHFCTFSTVVIPNHERVVLYRRFPARWGWLVVAAIAILMGGRRAYVVYDAASVQLAIVLICQMMGWFFG